MGRTPERLFRLPSAQIKAFSAPRDFPDHVAQFMTHEMGILGMSLDAAEQSLAIYLGKTITYVALQGAKQRRMLAGNKPQWIDTCLVYQVTTAEDYIGWGALALPNPEIHPSAGPFVANIEINSELRKQGHGTRLASLLHRLSQTFWSRPVGSGPSDYLSADGRRLVASFERSGLMMNSGTDTGSQYIATG